MVDFDSIEGWAPLLADALRICVPTSVATRINAAQPRCVEDALEMLFELVDRDRVIDAALAWIRSTSVFGYHGTRLSDAELLSIRASGLIPLLAEARRDRLERALSAHPRWSDAKYDLDEAIRIHGQGNRAGRREGQVHLTLSRYALTNRFNHYLTHGAEFDQHVAHALLGQEGEDMLRRDGKSRIVTIAVPGSAALDAAHRYFTIDDVRAMGDVPNVVNEFLKAWGLRLSRADFQCRTLKVDCGMVFRSTISPKWIVAIDTLAG